MKKALILFLLLTMIGVMVNVGLAQMNDHGTTKGGQEHPAMGKQQASHMMGSQMMNQEMMRNMTGLMKQMNEMMHKMTSTMDQKMTMDKGRMREMSRVMENMSVTMHEMSNQMGKGKMDPAITKKMKENIQEMNQMMDTIQRVGE